MISVSGMLNFEQIWVICNIVVGGVGLEVINIFIVDDCGCFLVVVIEEEGVISILMDECQFVLEVMLCWNILDFVEGVVGFGVVCVQVIVELNCQSVIESFQIFDLNGQVLFFCQCNNELFCDIDGGSVNVVFVFENFFDGGVDVGGLQFVFECEVFIE